MLQSWVMIERVHVPDSLIENPLLSSYSILVSPRVHSRVAVEVHPPTQIAPGRRIIKARTQA